jgi:NitT/TauT family transport system substrate-binding protein
LAVARARSGAAAQAALVAVLLGLGCTPTTSPAGSAAPASQVTAPAVPGTPASPALSGSAAAPVAPATLVPTAASFKLGLLYVFLDAGVFLGIERGYFREQGIDLELTKFNSATDFMPALAAGQLDGGGGGINAGLMNKGINSAGHGNWLVLRRDLADSGRVREVADLRGENVAVVSEQSAGAMAFDHEMQRVGLRLADLNTVVLGFPEINGALANGRIEAANQVEPFATIGVRQGILTKWKGMDEVLPNQHVAVMLFGQAFAAERRELGHRFMVAYLKGVRDWVDAMDRNRGREQVVDVMMQYTPLQDRTLFDDMRPAGLNPDGYIDFDSIARDVRWYADNGYMDRSIDVATIVDHSHVDYALGVLGRYQ